MTAKTADGSHTTAQGSLIVISGFSGVGKGTVVKALLSAHEEYELSISATTRAPRETELDGREYHFLTRDTFEKMIEQNDLVEYTSYCGNYYGTPRSFLENKRREGRDVILEIEVNGALNIRRLFPDAILLFMMPPSGRELVDRLTGRGSENEEVIAARLKRAAAEAASIEQYDYVVVNDTPAQCAERIHLLKKALQSSDPDHTAFIDGLRTMQHDNQTLIQQVRRELDAFVNEN